MSRASSGAGHAYAGSSHSPAEIHGLQRLDLSHGLHHWHLSGRLEAEKLLEVLLRRHGIQESQRAVVSKRARRRNFG